MFFSYFFMMHSVKPFWLTNIFEIFYFFFTDSKLLLKFYELKSQKVNQVITLSEFLAAFDYNKRIIFNMF
jgi:hypothetical protein